jgi:signal transduction histidine kinase
LKVLRERCHDLRQPVHAMGLLIETIHLRNKDASLDHLLGDLRSSVRSANQMFNYQLDLS